MQAALELLADEDIRADAVAGVGSGNTVAGSLLSIQLGVTRRAAEDAITRAMAKLEN